MQLQFNKAQVQCLHMLAREVQSQELTQEVRLTDGMPDVGRIVASWGQPIIRGKEWRSNGMQVSGGVTAWTLYMPEDGGPVQCVEAWLPFQMKWDLPSSERDGTICVAPLVQAVDARCLSSRKIMVRAGISMLGEAMVTESVDVSVPGELPEDIQILQQTYPMQIPKEAGEKSFSVETELALPAAAPALEKLLGYELRFDLRETKLVGDKLVFRGVATVHLRYLGTDGRLHSWDLECPFSQYADLEGEHEENAQVRICFGVTGAELEQGAEEKLILKANILAQYTVYDRYMAQLAADAYSTVRNTETQMEALNFPAVLSMTQHSVDLDKLLETECVFCSDAAIYPDHPKLYREDGKLWAQLSGTVQLLGYDALGQLCANTSRWDIDYDLVASADAGGLLQLNPVGATASMGSGSANVQATLPVNVITTRESDIPMLTGLEIGEATVPDPDRPGVILRRAGDLTLWELAKKLGSTVEAIQTANGLQQEPENDQMLLIPVL